MPHTSALFRMAVARALCLLTLALPTAAPAALDATPATRLDVELRCLLGVYQLPAGVVTITGLDGQPRGLRYTLSDGRFGALAEAPGGRFADGLVSVRFATCHQGRLRLDIGGQVLQGRRLPLREKVLRFQSDGVLMHGKLVLPATGPARALAVWVEGSNNDPSTDDSVWPYELARRGVATFVYDKRGTGASDGAQTSDFQARARDTAAALRAARQELPGTRRVGVVGASQGGWVAPLVGRLLPLDFMVAAYALADGPIAQDRAIVAGQLQEAGFGAEAQREAEALTSITERIVRADGQDGLEALDAFRARQPPPAWLATIQPRSYTGLLLQLSSEQIRTHGPAMAQGLPFGHDPRPAIEALRARQLWLLGGQDRQAPHAATQEILRQLQRRGRPIAVALFPRAGHGLVEPQPAPAYAAGLFDLTARWILRGRPPAAGEFITVDPAGGR